MEFDCIVIGASAGGIPVLKSIFKNLPEDFNIPILVVLHLNSLEKGVLASGMGKDSRLIVEEADHLMTIECGKIYFAPGGYHLLVENKNTLALSSGERVSYSRPSIDVLFESAAEIFQYRLLGIICSGANADGADGVMHIKDHGGVVWAQNPAEAMVSTMPEAAIASGYVDKVYTVDQMSKNLNKFLD